MFTQIIVVVLFSFCVVGISAQSAGCDCFPVNTTHTTLKQLAKRSPIYTIVANTEFLSANLDAVCYSIKPTCTPDNFVVEQANTKTDGSTLVRAGIQTTLAKGQFVNTGPTRTYKDFILSHPCPGVFVVYRCPQTGTCETNHSKADVIVVSSLYRGTRLSCVKRGIEEAGNFFPELSYFSLPARTNTPCSCEILSANKINSVTNIF